MLKIMTITKYDAAIAAAVLVGVKSVSDSAENERKINQRALDAERSIVVSLRAAIAELKPAADKWNAAQKKRKAKRESIRQIMSAG